MPGLQRVRRRAGDQAHPLPPVQRLGRGAPRQQTILGQFVSVTTCPRCNGEREIAPTPCANCSGQRRVRVTRKIVVSIPPGVDDGMRIRLANEGEPGDRNGPAGSLFVVLSVRPHAMFQRQENDILLELPVNIVQAALGAEVEVPTLEGKEKVNIKPGTQHGEVIRLKGRGVPILRANGRRGDELIHVKVVVPERLNDKQKKLLLELGQSLGLESLGKDNRNLFEKLIDSVETRWLDAASTVRDGESQRDVPWTGSRSAWLPTARLPRQ